MFHKILENGNLQVTIPIKFRTISARHKMFTPLSVYIRISTCFIPQSTL